MINTVTIALGLWISYEDIRTQTVSLPLITGFTAISFYQGLSNPDFLNNLIITFLCLLSLICYEVIQKKNSLGIADKILLCDGCAWVSQHHLPELWILSGFMGILSFLAFFQHNQRIPFCPAILLSIALIKLCLT